jgi:zinc transport system ATP-binding protein
LRYWRISSNRQDYVSIVGPNGSGKTTLIKLALGFKLTEKYPFHRPPADFADWRKSAICRKAKLFNPHFPAVREIVALGLLAKGFPEDWGGTHD